MNNLPPSTLQDAVPLIGHNLKLLFFLFVISTAAMYFQFIALGAKRLLFPGDYYVVKMGRRIYIPIGGVILLTMVGFLLLTTKLGLYAFMMIAAFVLYKAVLRKKL